MQSFEGPGKGNRDAAEIKSLLAQPKRDGKGEIVVGPDGRPVYPTKAELGIPYAQKKRAVVADFRQLDRIRKNAVEASPQPDVPVLPVGSIVEPEFAPPGAEPVLQAPVMDVNELERAEEEALDGYDTNAFDASIQAGGDVMRIPPNELHVPPTPGVPPAPTSGIEDTSQVQL